MSYITLQDIKAFLEVTTTGDDDELEDAIGAAQKEIENYCKREFEGSTGTRYYKEESIVFLPEGTQYRPIGTISAGRYSWDVTGSWGNVSGSVTYGHSVLWLDKDLLSISSLLNGDGTAISSTSYWLEPRNDPPYRTIRLRSDEQWVFNTDGEVAVAGTWGYSTGPDVTIKRLTKELAAYLYKARDNPVYDVTATPELGLITVPKGFPEHVKMALEKGGYVRKRGPV